MSVSLNNTPTTDGYTDATTLHVPNGRRLTMHVRNAAVLYQLGDGYGGVLWRDEVFLPPSTFSGDRVFDVVRVRSAVPGVPAQITIDAGQGDDA